LSDEPSIGTAGLLAAQRLKNLGADWYKRDYQRSLLRPRRLLLDLIFPNDKGDDTARLWEAESGNLLATFQGDAPVLSAVFSPDGRQVLTASGDVYLHLKDPTARLWDAESGKLLAVFQGHTAAVNSAVFSPDGRRVLTASWDKAFKVGTVIG
jgi:WD40 repeat protein